MQLRTRKILDRSFSGFGIISIILMSLALLIILAPIFVKGISAIVFKGTIEFRELQLKQFDRGNEEKISEELAEVKKSRSKVYAIIEDFEAELDQYGYSQKRTYQQDLKVVKEYLWKLLGPPPGQEDPVLIRNCYGETRWDNVEETLFHLLNREKWDYSNPDKMGIKVHISRKEDFKGTKLEPLFTYLEENVEKLVKPKWTVYLGFFFDKSYDSHFFGGIWPEILGTFYLTLGAMVFAVPLGVIAAIYLTEFASEGKIISLLRIFISTLAGVPSIVFGLFGLAFFINTVNVSHSKSVLAGSLTLSILILPTIIRASEEAIRSVPDTYRKAALSLGATKWHTVLTVVLPAALPGILTGIVISMGRAAGETAPIIFTAAVSVGQPLKLFETVNQPTPALSWNIYNLATEHEAVNEIRHVQFGMVFTLIMLVLILNLSAIIIRAKISKKMRG